MLCPYVSCAGSLRWIPVFTGITMALLRPHKGMKIVAGFLAVIPANAGIQGVRGEDGFPLSRE